MDKERPPERSPCRFADDVVSEHLAQNTLPRPRRESGGRRRRAASAVIGMAFRITPPLTADVAGIDARAPRSSERAVSMAPRRDEIEAKRRRRPGTERADKQPTVGASAEHDPAPRGCPSRRAGRVSDRAGSRKRTVSRWAAVDVIERAAKNQCAAPATRRVKDERTWLMRRQPEAKRFDQGSARPAWTRRWTTSGDLGDWCA